MNNEIPDEIVINVREQFEPFSIDPGHPMHSGTTDEPETVQLEFASSLEVDDLAPEVERVLEALGYAGAWVSDLSDVSDFGIGSIDLDAAARELGVPVSADDRVVEIARRLRRKPA